MRYLHVIYLVCLLGPASIFAAPGPAADWVLRGTLVTRGADGMAIIENPADGEQLAIKVGEELVKGTQLLEVHADYALAQSPRGKQRLEYGDRIGGKTVSSAGSYQVSWADLPDLMEQLEVIPHQQDGRVVGYYLNRIHGDIGEKIGLRNGDLLLAVNGVPLDQDLDPATLYREISNTAVQLRVRRQGKFLQLSYQVNP